jgi:hypothetical protein
MPFDQKAYVRQKAALTRAINSKDKAKIEAACKKAVAEWNAAGGQWPDDWNRWQIALDDAYSAAGLFHAAPRLENL